MAEHPVILFDGVCNLCTASVIFIINRDSRGRFKFASAQSESGRLLQNQYQIDAIEAGTIAMIKDGVVYVKSDAAIEIAKELDGFWKLLSAIRFVPKPVRDWVYTRIAQNRYHWFGKKDQCLVPTPALRSRFL